MIKESIMFGIGFPELIVILVIGLIVLGPNKLPELAKALAKGLAEFKKATQEIKKNLDVDDNFKEIKENLDGSIRELKANIADSMSGIDNPLKDLKNDINDSLSAINNPVEEKIQESNDKDAQAISNATVEDSLSEELSTASAVITDIAVSSESLSSTEPPITAESVASSDPAAGPESIAASASSSVSDAFTESSPAEDKEKA
jgi:Tat protein translocase TatB subunit